METITAWHDGVQFIIPSGFEFINKPLLFYPEFCGPGKKMGQIVVPDILFGINFGAACHIHDEMWRCYPKSWTIFHCSNGIFLQNMNAIYVNFQDLVKNIEDHKMICRLLMIYFTAVSTAGAFAYWKEDTDE